MTPIRKRWFPLWIGLLFFVGWCVIFAVTVGSEVHGSEVNWDGLVAVLPLLWLVGYGTACALLNHTTVGVSKDSVDITTGPLPGGGRRRIARNQIKRSYYRLVLVPTRSSNVQDFAVGVEMKDGRRVNLLADYESIEEASAVSREIAAVLGVQAEQVTGPANRDWISIRRVVVWVTLFAIALLVAALNQR